MTIAQRRLKWKWMAILASLSVLVLFDGFFAENAAWIRWLVFFGIMVGAMNENRTRVELETEGRARIAAAVESAPWLKVWFTLCAFTCIATAVVVTRRGIDLLELVGFKYFVLALCLVVGPLFVVLERQRYMELAEGGDAI